MRDQSMPEDWSGGKPSRMGDASSYPQSQSGTPSVQHPEDSGIIPQRISRSDANPEGLLQQTDLPNQASTPQSLAPNSLWSGASPLPPTNEPSPPTNTNRRQWLRNWIFWAAVAGIFANGVAFIAVLLLLKSPSAPNCPSIFWPLASGSIRLHCAQIAASKQTVPNLLEAIALVKALPANHPMRADIDRSVEQWSQDILALAEDQFQAGKLPAAIAIAKKIPTASTAKLVQERTQKWRSTWSQAESIYAAAEAEIPKQRWHQAYMTAVRLLNVGNNYWETTKYEQLKNNIETARADGEKLLKAEDLANQGRLSNLLEAIKIVQAVDKDSYMYQKAQDLIPKFGRKMFDLAQKTLDRQDADEAIAIANQIPDVAKLESEVQDFITIAEAKRSAWSGTAFSIETAIATAQKIGMDRPLYSQAQELITRWQLEIEDVQHLERARELAQPGGVGDLNAAIAEASLIPESNPRISEARQDISRWRTKVETFEDKPYLDRAEEIALSGQVNDLQSAINEASRINQGRALYRQARRKIRTWTRQIQTIEDQPYLDQARELANSGNLPSAIATAGQIQSGRALYREARTDIRNWQSQIQAEQNWREAQQIAQSGTPDDLAQAIRIADRVPNSNSLRGDANVAINDWGERILRFAQERGMYDMRGGIAIAQKIPRSSPAYRQAQEQIGEWNKILNPPPPEPIQEPDSEPLPNLEPNN